MHCRSAASRRPVTRPSSVVHQEDRSPSSPGLGPTTGTVQPLIICAMACSMPTTGSITPLAYQKHPSGRTILVALLVDLYCCHVLARAVTNLGITDAIAHFSSSPMKDFECPLLTPPRLRLLPVFAFEAWLRNAWELTLQRPVRFNHS